MELCKYRTYEIPDSTRYGDEYCMYLCMYFVLCNDILGYESRDDRVKDKGHTTQVFI